MSRKKARTKQESDLAGDFHCPSKPEKEVESALGTPAKSGSRGVRKPVSARIIARCLIRRRLRLAAESEARVRGCGSIEGNRPDSVASSEMRDELDPNDGTS